MFNGSLAKPNKPSTALIGETPESAGSNSGRSASLSFLITSQRKIARQHDLRLARHRLARRSPDR